MSCCIQASKCVVNDGVTLSIAFWRTYQEVSGQRLVVTIGLNAAVAQRFVPEA